MSLRSDTNERTNITISTTIYVDDSLPDELGEGGWRFRVRELDGTCSPGGYKRVI